MKKHNGAFGSSEGGVVITSNNKNNQAVVAESKGKNVHSAETFKELIKSTGLTTQTNTSR